MDIKKQAAQKKITEIKKPFLTGSITDENTFKSSVKFLGLLIMVICRFYRLFLCRIWKRYPPHRTEQCRYYRHPDADV